MISINRLAQWLRCLNPSWRKIFCILLSLPAFDLSKALMIYLWWLHQGWQLTYRKRTELSPCHEHFHHQFDWISNCIASSYWCHVLSAWSSSNRTGKSSLYEALFRKRTESSSYHQHCNHQFDWIWIEIKH